MTQISTDSIQTLNDFIQNLTLMNNLYMATFFADQPECAEQILREILSIPDLEVVSARTEHRLVSLQSHSVCLDVLAVDSRGNRYDIEIQSDPSGADLRRARYYSALLDSSSLPKGEPYTNLPDTFVVFVTDGDALGLEAPLLRLERCVVGGDGVPVGDGSHIVYVDASYNYGNSPLGDVVHDFTCPDPSKMRCSALADRARYLKETEEGVKAMGNIVDEFLEKRRLEAEAEGLAKGQAQGHAQGLAEGRAEGRAEGLAEGRSEGRAEGLAEGLAEGRREVIAQLLASGNLTPEQISQMLDIPADTIAAMSPLDY